jgi:hypothetical protein
VSRHCAGRVSPFGNPRIKACLPLPGAYRSLPRPSSPSGAKASIVRPCALDQVKPWSLDISCLPLTMQLSKNNEIRRLTAAGMPKPHLGDRQPAAPCSIKDRLNSPRSPATRRLVGVPGVEPGTLSLSGTRSNQLSYTPGLNFPQLAQAWFEAPSVSARRRSSLTLRTAPRQASSSTPPPTKPGGGNRV